MTQTRGFLAIEGYKTRVYEVLDKLVITLDVKTLLLLFIFLNFLDTVSTSFMVGNGLAQELNPLMSKLFDHGIMYGILAKVVGTLLVCLLFIHAKNDKKVLYLFNAANMVYVYVVLNNFVGILMYSYLNIFVV